MIAKNELFDNITWDEGDELSGGTINLADGKTAAFTFDGFETGEWSPELGLKTLKFLAANEPLIRHKIAVLLLESYNDTWLYETPFTPEELARKIYLAHADILTDDGSADIIYEADEDLFACHSVQVLMDATGKIDDLSIEG